MPPGKRRRPLIEIKGLRLRHSLPRVLPDDWFTLHDAGKNPESVAKVRSICADYGLYLPEDITALRAAESAE